MSDQTAQVMALVDVESVIESIDRIMGEDDGSAYMYHLESQLREMAAAHDDRIKRLVEDGDRLAAERDEWRELVTRLVGYAPDTIWWLRARDDARAALAAHEARS